MPERDRMFAAMLEAHGPFIRNGLRTYEHDRSRQEELFQEVALALWRALPSFRGDASHRTLIARITHNIGVSHIRKDSRTPPMRELDDVHTSPLKSPETEAQQNDQRQALQHAVARLPLGLRQVVSLYLDDCSNREIAEILGLSEGAVAVRLTRARTALAKLMETR